MRNEQFDNLIREKLAELRLPYRAADWSLMAQRLDQAFDAAFKNKLQLHTESYHPSAWAEMSARLDEAFDRSIKARLQHLRDQESPSDFWPVMAALLAGNPFEAQLAQKLLTLKLQGETPDWETMLQRLEDDAFVSYLRQQLDELHIAEPAEDWPDLRKNLDQQFDQSLGYKLSSLEDEMPADADWEALEAALPHGAFDQGFRLKLEDLEPEGEALSSATDWQRLASELDAPFDRALRAQLQGTAALPDEPTDWDHMAALLDQQGTVAPARRWTWQRNFAVAASFLLFLMAGLWWQTGDQGRLAALRMKLFPGKTSLAQASSPAKLNQHPSTHHDPYSDGAPTQADTQGILREIPPQEPPTPVVSKLTPGHSPSPLMASVKGQKEAVQLGFPLNNDQATPARQASAAERSSLAQVHPLRLPYTDLASPQFGHKRAMEMLLPPDDYPADVKIGLLGSYTQTRAELSGPRAEPGYQLGLRLELGLNQHWQLITGVGYGERNFNHDYHVSHGDKLIRNQLEASMRLLELPLIMRYRFPSEDNLTLYAQAGIVAILSLEETYQHYDPVTPMNANRLPALPNQLLPEERAWNLITYPGNVVVGLGLEYQATPAIALQLEPFFLQSLQRTKGSGSLGLEKKLYTTGLNFGVIFDLNADSRHER